MTNEIAVQTQALTPSEQARAEQLVWTQDKGRGWNPFGMVTCSSDLQILHNLATELKARRPPAGRVMMVGLWAGFAILFRAEPPADSWEMLFDDYAADLQGISAAHLRDAVEGHRR